MQKITINDKKYEIDFDQAIKLGLLKEEKPFTTQIGTFWQNCQDIDDHQRGLINPADTYILAAVGGVVWTGKSPNVLLVNMKDGGHWGEPKPVDDCWNITEKEFKQICEWDGWKEVRVVLTAELI